MSLLRPDLAIIADHVAASTRVLDIGCGDGTLMAELRERSQVDARGLELDSDNVAAAVAKGLSVIQGDADEIVDPQAVYAWIAALPRQPQLLRMPDTSHFFHRKLMDLRGALRHGVRDWLPAA